MKKIEFYPTSKLAEQVVPYPKPSKFYMPKWYKELRPIDGSPRFHNGMIVNKTVKSCVPFFDAVVSGYIQETWCDINISIVDGALQINSAHGPDIIGVRTKANVDLFDSFSSLEFFWHIPWLPKVENGYSCLFTHPLNNFSLPFVSSSGIIDSDLFYQGQSGNYPVYFYREFFGTIPAGTPMYQIIPMRRDSWESSPTQYNEEESIKAFHNIRKSFAGGYKKLMHKKKIYR